MKKILILIILIFFNHCSFDDKSGIWQNSSQIKKKSESFKNYKDLYIEEKLFDKVIELKKNVKIGISPIKKNLTWLNKNYNKSNNSDNFSYKNLNEIIFKSKKLINGTINENILFDGDKAIIANDKGDIIVYSIKNRIISFKYNFYRKRFKNLEKKLNFSIDNNILYVNDNIGYLYALDYNNKKLLWAKNFKVPFRSNLSIFDNKIIIADTNNVIYLINKFNGEQLRSIPTEENPLKSNFSNSIVLNDKLLFFLNTYGSIYSTDYKGNIRWFLNVNRSSTLKNNLFDANPIIIHNEKIIISTNFSLFVMNVNNGSLINKTAISSIIKPVISNNNLFLITEKNLLVCINLNSGEILYSLEIESLIANFLKTKKKSIKIRTLFFSNNSLFLFLDNSYLIKILPNGDIIEINKLPSKIKSLPIFINDSILYLNNKNRLIVLD